MTDTIGPFDSSPWSQDQWYRHAPKWAPSGVNGSPAASTTTGDLSLTLTGLNFTIGTGRALVRGAGFERTGTPASQAIPANTNASNSRRDRVVLRRDLAAKTLAPVLIQGTPSGSPVAPAITQSESGSWDLPLFSFLVPHNSGTAISGIVDERGWLNGGSGEVAFGSTAARDAHFPSASDGLTCQVNGYPQVYRSGQWRGVASQLMFTGTATGTTETVTTNVMTYSVPDPGITHQLKVSASVLLPIVGAGVTVFPEVRINGAAQNPRGANINGGGSGAADLLASLPATAISTSRTGAATVTLTIVKSAGSAGNGYSTAASSVYNMLAIEVVPA